MGMYGGLLRGRRARRQDDLREAQFDERRRATGALEGYRERQMGLQERQFAAGERQRDRQYGLEKRREARLQTAQQRAAQAEREKRRTTRYGRAYQAAAMGDGDEALRIYNEGVDPRKHATSIVVDENKNLIIDRRGDSATIAYDTLRRYLPKDPIEYAEVQKGGGATGTDVKNYRGLLAFHDAAQVYDFPKDDEGKPLGGPKRAFVAAIKAGKSPEQAAMELGLKAKLPERAESRIAEIDATLEGLMEKKRRSAEERAEIEALKAHREAILANAVRNSDPVVQAANQQLVQQFPGFDTNQDQRIDELDKDYQTAVRIVDIISKNPQAKAAFMQRYGGQVIAQAEALVKAMKQREALIAERRVGLMGK